MTRVSMWPMWGLPLAVGGPSKKVKVSPPSRWWKDLRMMSFSFQKRVISASRAGKFMSVGTLLYMLYLLLKMRRGGAPEVQGRKKSVPRLVLGRMKQSAVPPMLTAFAARSVQESSCGSVSGAPGRP